MASCKDCLYYECCKTLNKDFIKYPKDYENNERMSEICLTFKDRSKFVELPCKIGDTVYYLTTKYEKQGRKKVAVDYAETGIVDSITLGDLMIPQIYVCDSDNVWTTFDTKRDFNKIIFLTKEEAEKALEELKQ